MEFLALKVGLIVQALILSSVLLLAACGPGDPFEDPSERATREYEGTRYFQTVAAVDTQAATVVALQATVDHAVIMATQIGQLTFQNQALQATLTAMSAAGNHASSVSPVAAPPAQPTSLAPPQPGQGGTVVLRGNTTYRNLTTASDIRFTDGCAVDSVSIFSPSQSKIYLTVIGSNVQQGTRYSVTWMNDGQAVPTTDAWTADQNYDQICIWFFIEAPFEPGSWTADLNANGSSVGQAKFTVTGATGATPEAN